jgi:hypothetical protein
MSRGIYAVFVAAALTAAPALARERLLAPTEDWQLSRSEESCLLRRNFKDPANLPLRLDIEAFAPGQTYKFLMVGSALPLREGLRRGAGIIRYRFKPDPDWRETGSVTGYVDGEDAISFQTNLSTRADEGRYLRLGDGGQSTGVALYQPDLARAAQVVQFALAYPARDDTVLQLGPMDEAMADLHACTRELVASWGYDPAALEALSSPPILQNGEVIGSKIASEMRKGSLSQTVAINFRLDIDAEGKVGECSIQAPRRDSAMAELVCRLLREEAVVTPALDSSGTPVEAPLVSRVAFTAFGFRGGIYRL